MQTANDAQILQHMVENWTKEIPDWIKGLENKIVGRVILPTRNVGADVLFDIVSKFARTGEGAQILAKGVPPKGSSFDASSVPWEMFQVMDGFSINQKDIELYPKIKPNHMGLVMKSINRRENITAVAGDPLRNILGIKGAAELNTAGVFSAIKGPWNGSGAKRDIYEDLVNASDYMSTKFTPRFLVGNKRDMKYLMHRVADQMKEKFWQECGPVFDRAETDRSWMISVADEVLPTGHVYMIPYDDEAAEFVISENPTVRPIPLQPGGNYPIEVYEWIALEMHNNDAFVKIKITA